MQYCSLPFRSLPNENNQLLAWCYRTRLECIRWPHVSCCIHLGVSCNHRPLMFHVAFTLGNSGSLTWDLLLIILHSAWCEANRASYSQQVLARIRKAPEKGVHPVLVCPVLCFISPANAAPESVHAHQLCMQATRIELGKNAESLQEWLGHINQLKPYYIYYLKYLALHLFGHKLRLFGDMFTKVWFRVEVVFGSELAPPCRNLATAIGTGSA